MKKLELLANRFSVLCLFALYASIALILCGMTLGHFTTFPFAGYMAGVGFLSFIVIATLVSATFAMILGVVIASLP